MSSVVSAETDALSPNKRYLESFPRDNFQLVSPRALLIRSDRFMNAQPAVLGGRSRRTPRTVRTAEGRAAPRYVRIDRRRALASVMLLLAKEAMAVVKYFRLPLQLAPLD